MPRAANPDCPTCGGTGFRVIDARRDVSAVCSCMRRDVQATRLGWIAKAESVASSPLEGRERENLIILARSMVANSHLRLVLERLPTLTFRDVSDLDILDTALGKGVLVEELAETSREHSSIGDLVREPALIIIRASGTSYPNKALPGYFLQALRVREFAGKPTWIVTERPIVSGHLCWAEEVGTYIDDMFELVRLDGKKEPPAGRPRVETGQRGLPENQKPEINSALFGGKRGGAR